MFKSDFIQYTDPTFIEGMGLETHVDKQSMISGVSPEILKEIQNGRKLAVETIVLRSTQDVLATLLSIEADFVLVLNTLTPIQTIEEIISVIEKENKPVALLAFKFIES